MQPDVVTGAASRVERLERDRATTPRGRRCRRRSRGRRSPAGSWPLRCRGRGAASRTSATESATACGWLASDEPAGQRRLEALARGRFPVAQVPPEQPVELPDQAVAIRLELVEIDVVVGVGVGRRRRGCCTASASSVGQPGGVGLAQVDRDLGQRQQLPLAVGRAPHHHRVAEVGLVLNPVEVNAQRRRQLRRRGRRPRPSTSAIP